MSKTWGFKNRFVCDSGGAEYGIFMRGGDEKLEAVYNYSCSSYGVCDMRDWSMTVTASTWNELVKKLEKKHPTGWHWE